MKKFPPQCETDEQLQAVTKQDATAYNHTDLQWFREALQDSEDKFKILFDSSSDILLIIDGDSGQIRRASRTAQQILRYDKEALLGQHFSRLFPSTASAAGSEQGDLSVLDAVFTAQEVLRADGSVCLMDLTATVLPWEQGTAIFATLRDITERQRAEEALKESEERFRHLIEGSVQGVVIVRDWQALFLNQAYATIFGYARPEDICQLDSLAPLAAPAERARLQQYQEAHLRGDQAPVHYEYQGIRTDGTVIWLENRVRVVQWRGTPALQVTTVDITERKLAEATLRRDKDELERRVAARTVDLQRMNTQLQQEIAERKLAEQVIQVQARQQAAVASLSQRALGDMDIKRLMDDAVMLIAQTLEVDSCLVLEQLPDTCTLRVQAGTGWRDGVVGAVVGENTPTSPLGYALRARAQVTIDDLGADSRFCAPTLLHEHSVVSGVNILIPSRAAEPFGLLGAYSRCQRRYTADDILFLQAIANVLAQAIGRQSAEEALRQSAEQQRQLQKMDALGRLAGGVAHDFNNILTVVMGYSDLALHEVTAESTLHRDLTQIRKAGERGISLARHLLAFSRGQVLQPTVLNLNAVIIDIEKMLQLLIGEDITIVIATGEALSHVKADLGQLEQVLLNLAVNARDAMPQGGTLRIATANVEPDALPTSRHNRLLAEHYVMLEVSDTGCGMDAETQAHIFEPFFTTKEMGKGTGLGLSTVYGIVEQSGGHIAVVSAPEAGTVFRMYLPHIDAASPEATPRHAHSAPCGGSETILVAEDEEGVRALLRRSLERQGYTVLEAPNGIEALHQSSQYEGPIHLLLTDVVMPQMSGQELAERLTALRPAIKCVFMSGYLDDAIQHYGLRHGTSALLQKPILPSVLERVVRDSLDAPAPPKELVGDGGGEGDDNTPGL